MLTFPQALGSYPRSLTRIITFICTVQTLFSGSDLIVSLSFTVIEKVYLLSRIQVPQLLLNKVSVKSLYSHLTDQQLDGIVQEIQEQFPTCGNRQMQGHLQRRGIKVQQHRVRESQRHVDLAGSVMHQLGSINCQKYHVSGPGALWHIDGHHKLIRY